MKNNTFKLVVEPDGTEYVVQNIDEADKNHGPDDSNPTNDGRMYGDPCKFSTLLLNKITKCKEM